MPQTSHHSSQPRRRPTERISQHVLYGLLGYVVALFLAFFLFGYDTPYWKNDRMNAPMLTDVLLGAVYGIMALTTILAIVAGIHSASIRGRPPWSTACPRARFPSPSRASLS